MKNLLLDRIAEALDALDAVIGERAAEALSPSELVQANAAFGALKRRVDAAFAPLAAEIARQSRVELGRDSLAKKQGFRSPVALIQSTTGSSVAEAMKLVQVGEATAPRMSLTGETLPAKHPAVADGVAAGHLGVTAAAAIVSLLDRVAPRVDSARLEAAERELTAMAPGLRADELSRLLTRAEAHLDPDGVEPRHEQARAERSLLFQERDGLFHFQGVCDLESAAPIRAAVEGIVTAVLHRNAHADDAERDQRSVKQMRLDALSELCAHALGCDTVATGVTTTVVVRMTLEQLQSGIGAASLDGFDAPIPAATVRRMAADAQVIPCVLGGGSEILDWGRAKRLFTPAQKLALVERDGGCARCGAPPERTQVHHIDWWKRDRGRTDLARGVLLCTPCHHAVHDDGWEIRIEGATADTPARVWFVPPEWIDPARAPRLGGNARYALTA